MPTDPAFIRADQAIHRRFPMMAPKQRAEIVRDVLNAIREPDREAVLAGCADFGMPEDHYADARQIWPAMIDAILIQAPDQQAVNTGTAVDGRPFLWAWDGNEVRVSWEPTPSGTINSATGEVTEGPWDRQLREEADRQYPTGEVCAVCEKPAAQTRGQACAFIDCPSRERAE